MSSIDIYGNEIVESMDDGIETDYGLYNIRVWRNRITNVHTGISAQPSLAGPLYLIRNVIYNTTGSPFKLHNHSTGVLAYHNTVVSSGQAFSSQPPAWQNSRFHNNIFLGAKGWVVETGSRDRRTSLDYNGYSKAPETDKLIKWTADEGATWGRYATLQELAAATGHEAHGTVIEFKDFMGATAPVTGSEYNPI